MVKRCKTLICSSMEDRLYEKISLKRTFQRVTDSFIFLLLLLLLLGYSVISLTNHFNFPCFLAFLCESWFTYTWFVILSTKWTPARVITYLYAIPPRAAELPAVDLLVTTADPVLEPPIITVNTVLSLLALDYPSQKLACSLSKKKKEALVTFPMMGVPLLLSMLWLKPLDLLNRGALRPKKVELQSLELKSSQPRVELSSGLLSQISEVVASHPPARSKLERFLRRGSKVRASSRPLNF
ncbi:hypothetical protein K1719_026756 [Acacia pycnantha]|nr:hypothetical protein K1719_026756 [Acacia pycnantha]